MEDSSVFSLQWSLFPREIADGITPRDVLERYLAYLRRITLGIIRPTETALGLDFRLPGKRGVCLISFLPPDSSDGAITLRICGGLLVQPRQCHRGELRFSVLPEQDRVKILLQLSDYCPLLLGSVTPSFIHRWLYRLTQAAIHRLVTIRFLKLLYRDLGGKAPVVTVTPVRVRDGRPL